MREFGWNLLHGGTQLCSMVSGIFSTLDWFRDSHKFLVPAPGLIQSRLEQDKFWESSEAKQKVL